MVDKTRSACGGGGAGAPVETAIGVIGDSTVDGQRAALQIVAAGAAGLDGECHRAGDGMGAAALGGGGAARGKEAANGWGPAALGEDAGAVGADDLSARHRQAAAAQVIGAAAAAVAA